MAKPYIPQAPYPGLPEFPARHFKWNEVRCRHCAELGLHGFPVKEVLEGQHFDLFTKILDAARGYLGKPIIVTSWYRCKDHPIEARKKRPGVHAYGLAADLLLHGSDVASVIESVLHTVRIRHSRHWRVPPSDILGFGFQQKGEFGGRYLHVDIGGVLDEFRPMRGAVWSY